jgi:hypothetical protein
MVIACNGIFLDDFFNIAIIRNNALPTSSPQTSQPLAKKSCLLFLLLLATGISTGATLF